MHQCSEKDDNESADDSVVVIVSRSKAASPGPLVVAAPQELKRAYSLYMDCSKRVMVEKERDEVLDRALERVCRVAYVVDSFPYELSDSRMKQLKEATSLWNLIRDRCELHQANAAEGARLTSQAVARTTGAVGVRHPVSGHFFFGGVFVVPGIPLCKDLWFMVLRHLTPSQRRIFGHVSKAFSILSRSLFPGIIFRGGACGQQASLSYSRGELRRSGVTDGCASVLMLSGCRTIEFNNSHVPSWFIRKVIIQSISSYVPVGQQVDLIFSARMPISPEILHTAISQLVANRKAFDRVRSVIVSSFQAASVICSAVSLYQLGPVDSNNERLYSADRKNINQRLGELKVVLDASARTVKSQCDYRARYRLSMFEEPDPDQQAYYHCRAGDCDLLLASLPNFFVRTLRDFDLCHHLAASSIDTEAASTSLRVYLDPHGTLDPSQCERITLPRAKICDELAAEIAELELKRNISSK